MLQMVFRKMKDVLPPKASFRLRALKSDILDRELRDLKRFAKALGGPRMEAVDVGANSGIYSAALAEYFDRVISIEPNPDCIAYMESVLPTNCSVLASAISDVEGRTILRIPVVGGTSETTRATISAVNAFSGLDVSNTRQIDVAVRSLDGLAKAGLIAPTRLGLVKIDVEGHELAALKGAKTLLETARPGLCIEMERRHGTQTSEAYDLLNAIGYVSVRITGGRYAIEDAGSPEAGDIVNQFFVTGDKLPMLGLPAR